MSEYLDDLALPRSTAPQCEHPPVDCTAECRGVRARSTVARILVTLADALVEDEPEVEPEVEVRFGDLAAHILAVPLGDVGTYYLLCHHWAELIASSLLDEFHITRKK
ncbi:hypothetical protein SEA_XAVIA_45 [Mycobacterium phage Xavia]|uniref:Uncharacterized protein n=1 Tax=Mycobacterium phage Xavia TaxID=2178923 RepID=A0A2U8UHL6_9CAUD|nr:hypothetical protein I5J51_gp45 [Mycobacterium phage Xavia]AWN02647.1 hypothetical protein SEA_XAVIA_45 [Mycobacterium phage Xavia]